MITCKNLKTEAVSIRGSVSDGRTFTVIVEVSGEVSIHTDKRVVTVPLDRRAHYGTTRATIQADPSRTSQQTLIKKREKVTT